MSGYLTIEPNQQFLYMGSEAVHKTFEEGRKAAFEDLFKTNYQSLHSYAFQIVKDEIIAEEAIQNVFCRIWEKKNLIGFKDITPGYLYRAVHNESLNQLKNQQVRRRYEELQPRETVAPSRETHDFRQLQAKAEEALSQLPEQCRTIFHLSRYEHLKYREIADRLHISVKTVEAQMSKALRILRTKLADFLPLLLICLTLKR